MPRRSSNKSWPASSTMMDRAHFLALYRARIEAELVAFDAATQRQIDAGDKEFTDHLLRDYDDWCREVAAWREYNRLVN